MRNLIPLLITSLLIVGCSQKTEHPAESKATPAPPIPPATPVAAVPGDAVATVLGQPVKRSDCLSRSQGIGSEEVGIYALVLHLLTDEFSKSQDITLSQTEIDAFWKAMRSTAARVNPAPAKPIPDPVFNEAEVRAKLKQVQDQLQAADLSLLEKLTLQGQERNLQRGLELKSPATLAAWEHLYPLRVEAALYRQYGGKVVARQISIHAAGACLKLAETAQAEGRLVFHDESLRQAFWKRLQDDLANPEVPPEQIDFSLPVWLQFAGQLPPERSPNAATPTPPAKESQPGGGEMLACFAGIWRTTCEVKPSQSLPDGGKFTVQEVTQPTLKGQFIIGREQSAPDGRKSLWLMTWDAERQVYPFWIFDSDGLLGGQWELQWDAATKTATGHSIDRPADWISQATNRFPDPDTNLVDVLIKDTAGLVGLASHAEKKRQPEEQGPALLTEWSKSARTAEQTADLQVLDQFHGTWDAATVERPAVWTPQEARTTSVVTRAWILNDRFIFDSSQHSDGTESLVMIGFDPERKEYRSWWFNSEGHRSSARGSWDAITQTMSFQTEPDQGRATRSTVRIISPDQHEWKIQVTDAEGTVYFDSTITTQRRKPKPE